MARAFAFFALSGAVAFLAMTTALSVRTPVTLPDESRSTSGVSGVMPSVLIAKEFTEDMCPHTLWATAGCLGQQPSRSFPVMKRPSFHPLSFQLAPMTHAPSDVFLAASLIAARASSIDRVRDKSTLI